MAEKKHVLNVPSPYDLSGIKQASQSPDLLRMLSISYDLGVVKDERSAKQRTRKKASK